MIWTRYINGVMTEKEIESKFRGYCTKMNVVCVKFTSPGTRGVPDRILIGPKGTVGFCELKRPGKKPTKLQALWLEKLDKRGTFAGYVNSLDGALLLVDNFVAYDALHRS